jgi:hypothetical protein
MLDDGEDAAPLSPVTRKDDPEAPSESGGFHSLAGISALGLRGLAARRRRMVAVENVRIQVGPVRPHDRSEFLVHPHLPEKLGIRPQRLEHRTP